MFMTNNVNLFIETNNVKFKTCAKYNTHHK